MKLAWGPCVLLIALTVLHTSDVSHAFEMTPYQFADDLGSEPPLGYDCALQYYYYIPAPTASWFWACNMEPGDILGLFCQPGDLSTGGHISPDPENEYELVGFRVLDFAGYGIVYPALYTVEFDVYCADEMGCPVGGSLWNSGPRETGYGWNYISVEPDLDLCGCGFGPGPYHCYSPRIIIVATHIGLRNESPAWGLDNISSPCLAGEQMDDIGGLSALYPRPAVSHYQVVRSGYYGQHTFEYCPARGFADGADSTPSATEYGYLELAWTAYFDVPGG